MRKDILVQKAQGNIIYKQLFRLLDYSCNIALDNTGSTI